MDLIHTEKSPVCTAEHPSPGPRPWPCHEHPADPGRAPAWRGEAIGYPPPEAGPSVMDEQGGQWGTDQRVQSTLVVDYHCRGGALRQGSDGDSQIIPIVFLELDLMTGTDPAKAMRYRQTVTLRVDQVIGVATDLLMQAGGAAVYLSLADGDPGELEGPPEEGLPG